MKTTVFIPKDSIIVIDFPKQNPDAPRSQRRSYFTDTSNAVCSPNKNVAESVKCTISQPDADTDRITVSSAISQGLDAPAFISFKLDSLYNPISMTERFFSASFSIVGKDGKNYMIE
jgi:hypothetical protein